MGSYKFKPVLTKWKFTFFGAERKKFVKQEDNTLRDVLFYKPLVFSNLSIFTNLFFSNFPWKTFEQPINRQIFHGIF